MSKLRVHEMFNSIQTEGVLAGRPAYFIRLFGCNLDCSFCDTPQEGGVALSLKKIMKKVRKEAGKLVVITGGEPFLQHIFPLCRLITASGRYVQIETNGTVSPEGVVPDDLYIVVSPKTGEVDEKLALKALAFKYVISHTKPVDIDGLPMGLFKPEGTERIMLSPCFTDNEEETAHNIQYAVDLCMKHGYYLSIQYHKLIGIQ